MNILIGNHTIMGAGGSEEHARTLAAEFERRGYVTLFDLRSRIPKHDGPAFLAHGPVVRRFLDHNPTSRCIQTIHGLSPQLERPVLDPRVRHVAVSREIAEAYPVLQMPVIMNGVDLDRFKPSHDLPKKPGRVLFAGQSEELSKLVGRICWNRELHFRSRNKFANPTDDIERDMRWADIVIAIGRTAIEAAACGKMVILADHRPYQPAWGDGLMTVDGLSEIQASNYSGRWGKMNVTEPWIEEHLDLYHPMWGKQSRKIAEQYHDVKNQADAYLRLWEEFSLHS